MINRTGKHILCIIFIIMLTGCLPRGAIIDTFQDDGIRSEHVRAIAIFPLRNAQKAPGASIIINRDIQKGLSRVNTNIKFIDPASSSRLMGKAKLTSKYANFLKDYAISGIIDAEILKLISNSLKVDAILQGEIIDLIRMQGGAGKESQTIVNMRYSLMSTRSGKLLWQGTVNASDWVGGFSSPPPVNKVVDMAVKKIISAFPKFQ